MPMLLMICYCISYTILRRVQKHTFELVGIFFTTFFIYIILFDLLFEDVTWMFKEIMFSIILAFGCFFMLFYSVKRYKKLKDQSQNCPLIFLFNCSGEIGGYAALYANEFSRTYILGNISVEVTGTMYYGSISGGIEWDCKEGSFAITSPTIGFGCKLGADFDWNL